MEYRLLDGKATAARLRAEIAAEVEQIVKNGGRRPALTAILVGNDPASQTYVANKDKSCKEVGFAGDVLRLPETTTQEELIKIVNDINANSSIDGLIVQLASITLGLRNLYRSVR